MDIEECQEESVILCSIDILDPCSLPKRFNGRVSGLQTSHDLDPETEPSADIISEYTIVKLVLCNLARV